MITESRSSVPSDVFRRRLRVGFAAVAALCVVISAISFYALRTVIEAKDLVISDYAHNLLRVRDLEITSEQEISSSRAYLLTRDPDFETKALRSRREFSDATATLRAQIPESERGLIDRVIRAEKSHREAMELAIKEAGGDRDPQSLSQYFEQMVMPKRDELRVAFRDLIHTEERQLEALLGQSGRSASRMSILVLVIGVSAVVLAGGLFFLSGRTLRGLALAEREVQDLNQALEGRVAVRTAELTRTVRELEGFAYTVAHDLRAPLRAMCGYSRLMIEDFGKDIPESGHEYLAKIDLAAKRMDEMIVGLLDYSGLSYSKIELRSVDLNAVVGEALKDLGTEIAEVSASMDVEEGLGAVVANEVLLRRVVDNLISNALKFMRPGIPPIIRIWTNRELGRVCLSVKDNGIGIAAEYRERIFGVFERLHRAEDYPGTGIGLAIVRKAVERMGGRVGVESHLGAGSRFWVELPAA